MTRAFTLASWNVEHFKNEGARVERIVQFMREQNPDVFALLEVEGKDVYAELVKRMPDYHFHITEGPQIQEILVGVRGSMTAFFTQKTEFKSGIKALRPGALLSLNIGDVNYSILFLHTKSSSKPIGLGIRDDMFARAFAFRKVLDKAAGGKGKANFLFLGDLNVMGMKYPFKKNIEPPIELQKLAKQAKNAKMKLLAKNFAATWWNGPGSSYPMSDLDQVIASDHLEFKFFKGAEVDVRGWPQKQGDAARKKWIDSMSDHALIFMQVERK